MLISDGPVSTGWVFFQIPEKFSGIFNENRSGGDPEPTL